MAFKHVIVNSLNCPSRRLPVKQYESAKGSLISSLRFLSDSSSKTHVQTPLSYAWGTSSRPLQYITIGHALDRKLEKQGHKPAIISCHENIHKTFAQFNDDVTKLTVALTKNLGLKRHDVVSIWSANCYKFVVLQYACARVGILLCPLNPAYKGPEVEYGLNLGEAKVLFMPNTGSKQETLVNGFNQIFHQVAPKLVPGLLKHVVYLDGGQGDIGPIDGLNQSSFDELLADVSGDIGEDVTGQVCPDDAAALFFTSGTTGKPKAAALSHFTLINNTNLNGHRVNLDENSSVCLPIPLFHGFASIIGTISLATRGNSLVLTGFKYDIKSTMVALVEQKCSHIMPVPAMTIDMIDYLQKNPEVKLNSLQNIVTASAATPVEVAQKICQIVPSIKRFNIIYGATETGPVITAPHRDDGLEKTLDNVGAPLDLVEVKIVDKANDRIVPLGQKGELLTRGHHLMLGYHKNEAKTREAIDDKGWYSTGDLAQMDEEGYIKIVGRTKEIIIRGGENIYPRDIEEVLYTHPNILDVAVCGVPDKRLGEELCAWIKLNDPMETLTGNDIKQFLKDKMAYYKIPKYYIFGEDFPRTGSGKVQKFIMTQTSCKILNIQ